MNETKKRLKSEMIKLMQKAILESYNDISMEEIFYQALGNLFFKRMFSKHVSKDLFLTSMFEMWDHYQVNDIRDL